jgi:hypothetical protein
VDQNWQAPTPEEMSADRLVIIGAAIAAVFWAASGVAAIFSPTGDASEFGSWAFYVIEGTHAIAETGMIIALLGLWRGGRPWDRRSARAAFVGAIAATGLLAVLTYLSVVLAAAGVPREFGEDVVSLLFLISLLGTLITFIWLGIVVVRSALMPSGVGWL